VILSRPGVQYGVFVERAGSCWAHPLTLTVTRASLIVCRVCVRRVCLPQSRFQYRCAAALRRGSAGGHGAGRFCFLVDSLTRVSGVRLEVRFCGWSHKCRIEMALGAVLLVLAAQALRPLPVEYERAEDLMLHDGHRRRLTAGNVLDEIQDDLHISFTTPSRTFSMSLHRVDVWAPDARLIVNERGQSKSLSLPRSPVYRGRLSNQDDVVGGGVSSVVLADGTLRVHVYEDGEDLIIESAEHFEHGAASFNLGDHIIFRDTSVEEHAPDAPLHHSSVPLPGVHAPEAGGSHRHLQSQLNTLPTGPPYGRLSGCPAAPAFYTSKIGIVVDHGFASAVGGGTVTAPVVTTEVSSIITQTNVIYADQVGVEFSLGTLIINLDASASLAAGGPNYAPAFPGNRSCGGDLSEGYTSRSVLQWGTSSTMVTVEEKGGAGKLLQFQCPCRLPWQSPRSSSIRSQQLQAPPQAPVGQVTCLPLWALHSVSPPMRSRLLSLPSHHQTHRLPSHHRPPRGLRRLRPPPRRLHPRRRRLQPTQRLAMPGLGLAWRCRSASALVSVWGCFYSAQPWHVEHLSRS
jgi:hypothetical protein